MKSTSWPSIVVVFCQVGRAFARWIKCFKAPCFGRFVDERHLRFHRAIFIQYLTQHRVGAVFIGRAEKRLLFGAGEHGAGYRMIRQNERSLFVAGFCQHSVLAHREAIDHAFEHVRIAARLEHTRHIFFADCDLHFRHIG